MPKGTPLTEEEKEKRQHEIYHSVVDIFLEKGFQETSMRELAEAAGLGKSTLYDYFKTKDEILLYYFEDQLNDMIEAAQKIAMQNMSADKRLRQIIQMHLDLMQANKNLFMKLSMEAQRLKPESQVKIQEKRHAYQDLIRTLIDEGISKGSFRKVDSLLAARILLSSLAPVVFTNRPSKVSKDLVNETIEIFFKGIEK